LAGERGVTMMTNSERAGGGENRFIPVRVRWFDDAALAAVAAGVDQVVLLGAGLDTRPYRLDLPARLDWFEVDRAELFAAKEPVLAEARPACRRHTVGVELAGDWGAGLTAAGFRPDRPTAWLAEGLFFYLAESSIIELLRASAALSGPGSRFLADVMSAAGLDQPAMNSYRDYCARQGLPPPFGSDDPAALLAAGGWRPGPITAPGAPDANYGRLPVAAGGVRPGRPHLVTGLHRTAGDTGQTRAAVPALHDHQ
jgi:methyltransferase (TIGR00027 family)